MNRYARGGVIPAGGATDVFTADEVLAAYDEDALTDGS